MTTEGTIQILLDVNNIEVVYNDIIQVLRGVSLNVPEGHIVALLGTNGAGKTTLLRTLLGLLPMDSGEIRWNGQIVDNPAAFFIPPRSAYTAQVPRLFSDTLRENLLLGLPQQKVDLSEGLKDPGIQGFK